jgi:hypothetical protein
MGAAATVADGCPRRCWRRTREHAVPRLHPRIRGIAGNAGVGRPGVPALDPEQPRGVRSLQGACRQPLLPNGGCGRCRTCPPGLLVPHPEPRRRQSPVRHVVRRREPSGARRPLGTSGRRLSDARVKHRGRGPAFVPGADRRCVPAGGCSHLLPIVSTPGLGSSPPLPGCFACSPATPDGAQIGSIRESRLSSFAPQPHRRWLHSGGNNEEPYKDVARGRRHADARARRVERSISRQRQQ